MIYPADGLHHGEGGLRGHRLQARDGWLTPAGTADAARPERPGVRPLAGSALLSGRELHRPRNRLVPPMAPGC